VIRIQNSPRTFEGSLISQLKVAGLHHVSSLRIHGAVRRAYTKELMFGQTDELACGSVFQIEGLNVKLLETVDF
jgi:hypothetical protein